MSATLTISRRQITGEQAELFHLDRQIDRPAAMRTHVGAFFEEASRVLFGAHKHSTDATADICPDLSLDGRHRYLEIKSVGHREGLVYSRRVRNDRRLLDQTNGELTYCFWVHHVKAMAFTSLGEMRAALASGIDEVLCVPFERLEAACRKLPEQTCNYRLATPTKEAQPMLGYRIPWKVLQTMALGRSTWHPEPFTAFGHTIQGLTVRGPDVGRCLPVLTREQRSTASYMAEELAHVGLDVALAPAPIKRHGGHCIRVVQSSNPEWYRDLAAKSTRARRKPRTRHLHDTDLRRYLVQSSLIRLSKGVLRYPYDFQLLPYVRQMASA
jgi:hypothetical protein